MADVLQFLEGGLEALEQARTLPPLPAAEPVPQPTIPHRDVTVEDAVASPEVRRPDAAVRTATFPYSMLKQDNQLFAASTPLMPTDYVIPAEGQIVIEVLLVPGTTATTMQMTLDGQETWGYLNGGANLVVGSWMRETHDVHQGDMVNFQFGAQVRASIRVTFREGV